MIPLKRITLTACCALSLFGITGVQACGLCSPDFIRKVAVNIVYPGALGVEGAVWQAQKARRLAMPDMVRLQATGEERELLDLILLRRTLESLKSFGTLMRAEEQLDDGSVTVLLVDEMMWSRYSKVDGSLRLQADSLEPEAGDLVIVTEIVVLDAIADGSLTVAEAIEMKTLRLYGEDGEITKFLAHCEESRVDPEMRHLVVTKTEGGRARWRELDLISQSKATTSE